MVVFSHFMGKSVYLFPAGKGDMEAAIRAMEQDAAHRGIPFRMTALSKEDCELTERVFPGKFHFVPDRDGWDYIYDIEDLAELKGKRYQSKRNHINRFLESAPQWHLEEIRPGNLELCRELLIQWYERHLELNPEMDYHLEQYAAQKAVGHYGALGLEGLVLYNGEEPIGLTMGSRLSETVFDVHFEKALGTVQGDYTILNRSFARHIREKYPEVRWLNREDDMGLPGLRKAKESYHPHHMVEQYRCFAREDLL